MTQPQLAERLGITQSTVSRRLSLLELPPQALDLIRDGKLTPAHAAGLMRYRAFPKAAAAIAGLVVKKEMSSRDIDGGIPYWVEEELVRTGVARKIEYGTPFDRKVCESCPEKAFFGRGGGYGLCLYPKGYEKHVQDAKDQAEELRKKTAAKVLTSTADTGMAVASLEQFSKAAETERTTAEILEGGRIILELPAKVEEDPEEIRAREEAAAALAKIMALPMLNDLPRETYRSLSYGYNLPEPCQNRTCGCCGLARSGTESCFTVVPICTNPKALEQMQRRTAADENKIRKGLTVKLWADAIAGQDTIATAPGVNGDPAQRRRSTALVFARALQDVNQGARKAVLALLEKDSPLYEFIREYRDSHDQESFLEAIEQIDVIDLIDVAGLLIAREEMDSALDNKSGLLPKTAFLLGKNWPAGKIPFGELAADPEIAQHSARNKRASGAGGS